MQSLAATGQIAMDCASEPVEGIQRSPPAEDEVGPLLDQPAIPKSQLARVAPSLPQIAQQGIALGDDAVVLRQSPAIGGIDLA